MKTNKILLITFLAISGIIVMCKPKPPGSESKSIDNFIRQDGTSLVINKCGIDATQLGAYPKALRDAYNGVKKTAKITADEAATKEITGALVAVPKPIFDVFFNEIVAGSIVTMTSDNNRCLGVLTSSEAKFAGEKMADTAPSSCWKVEDPKTGIPTIYIKNMPPVIHHSLLRTFGYVTSQYLVPLITKLAEQQKKESSTSGSVSKGVVSKESVKSIQQQNDLVTAMMADIQASDGSLTLGPYEDFKNSDMTRFANFVLAEAMDSYYCSEETHKTFMSPLFKNTYKVFREIAKGLGKPWFCLLSDSAKLTAQEMAEICK